MEEESVLLGGNGMGESKEDKRMRAKWESLSGAEKSEFKKNYAMRRGITIERMVARVGMLCETLSILLCK